MHLMANAVSILVSGGKYGREAGKIKKFSGRLIKALKIKNISLEICLVSNREIKRLNLRFRGKDRATNVLSLEMKGGPSRPDIRENSRYLGEIFLAPDYIRSHGENLDFLFLHGFLHILGYTHVVRRDTIKMQRLEDKLSKKLKI